MAHLRSPKSRKAGLLIFPVICHFNEVYASCSSLYNKVKRVGFNTPKSSYKSAKIIKEHIIKYGERKSIGMFNKMWEALEIKLEV